MGEKSCIRRILVVGHQDAMSRGNRNRPRVVITRHPGAGLLGGMHDRFEVNRLQRLHGKRDDEDQQGKTTLCPERHSLPCRQSTAKPASKGKPVEREFHMKKEREAAEILS